MAGERQNNDPKDIDDEEDAIEESIEVAGVPLVVWAARLSLFLLIQGIIVTLFAGFGTFTADHFGMKLDTIDNLLNWALALAGWGVGIYALWQGCLYEEEGEREEQKQD